MRVALVHDFLNSWGGGEQVLKVFTEIWPEAPIYTITAKSEIVKEFFPTSKIITSFLQNYPGMPAKFKYYLPFMPRAIESFNLDDFDLIISDSSAYAKGAIKARGAKHICYLHTPTRYLWSDREEYINSAPIPLPLIGRPVVQQIVKQLQKWDLEAARRPDVIIANSKFIAERTKEYYQRDPDYVLFPPVDLQRFQISSAPKDYFLVVARAEPYKRTDLAIAAANMLGFKLKVVGAGTKIEELRKLAGPTVEFIGRVSNDNLVGLYANCIAFIFPPQEDAGITPLEAMASGRPVIAYGEGGALESIVAGVTGEFFPKQTVESLATALRNFNSGNYDASKIRDHAALFDVSIFKKKIEQIVNAAILKG